MKVMLNDNETYYRQVVSSTGIAMLTLLLFMRIGGILQTLFQGVIRGIASDPVVIDIAEQLFYAGTYLLVFFLPAYILKLTLQRGGLAFHPMKAELRISGNLPIILLGGVFLIWTQSYVNGALVSIFNYSAFSSEEIWEQGSIQHGYQVVLQFIVAALIPAFCEEFLFRGAVLTNLLPFGRVPAVLISALLFAMMHQNAEQLLYSFAAGVLLGVVYERTGSIWNCFFLHMANNFASVLMDAITLWLPYGGRLSWAILEAAFCLISIGAVVWLTFVLNPKKPDPKEGFFGSSLSAADDYASHPISSSRAVQLFFNLPMILFFSLSAAQMISLIGRAWGYSYGM